MKKEELIEYKRRLSELNDEEIKDVLNRASDLFYSNMNTIINLLNEGVNNE